MRTKFINLLEEQPIQNFGNQNTKINIHIPIRGRMLDYCIILNNEIAKLTKSGIDFSPSSFQIPHITLEMGFIRNSFDFQKTMEVVYDFGQGLSGFEISPTLPYLKEPKKNYAFIDTEQTQHIISIKQQLKLKLNKFIEPLNWDLSKETPHITVAYLKTNFNLIATLFKDYRLGPSFYADAIEVSFGGPWGSCIGTIRTFEFGS